MYVTPVQITYVLGVLCTVIVILFTAWRLEIRKGEKKDKKINDTLERIIRLKEKK